MTYLEFFILAVGPFIWAGLWIGLAVPCVLHMVRHKRDKTWVVLLLVLPVVGAAIYALVEIAPSVLKRHTPRN